jgi:hypothetical protein
VGFVERVGCEALLDFRFPFVCVDVVQPQTLFQLKICSALVEESTLFRTLSGVVHAAIVVTFRRYKRCTGLANKLVDRIRKIA